MRDLFAKWAQPGTPPGTPGTPCSAAGVPGSKVLKPETQGLQAHGTPGTPGTPKNDDDLRARRIAEHTARAHRGAAAYAAWLVLNDVEGYGEAETAF